MSAAHDPLVFAHGNSFPGGTYTQLLKSLRQRGFAPRAVDKFGHDSKYPVTNNWPHLVRQLHDFAQREADRSGMRPWLVGHSLGGFLSVMCAARHPELARGVVLIDSPVLGGWRASAVSVLKQTQLVGALSPGAISRNRRHRWPDAATALEHFRHKRAFAHWDPQCLADYIEHGTHDEGGHRVLSFDREVETAIYNTLPDNLERLLKRHPLRCPAAFVGGTRSAEMRQVGMAMTERLTHGRIMLLEGTHLLPMERPVAVAAAVEASIRGMQEHAPA